MRLSISDQWQPKLYLAPFSHNSATDLQVHPRSTIFISSERTYATSC